MTKESLKQWYETVAQHMPHLSKPQAFVLALWSLGMVIARSCFLAKPLGVKENALRERLRDFYREASAKKGEKRVELCAESCFAPLLRWILSCWVGNPSRLALALDTTNLSDRFVVLAISVVYRGCAIPVAWKVVEGNKKGSWQPYWEHLFRLIKGAIPEDWFVLVLADRGLYAEWLFKIIKGNGWHPFLRINAQGFFRPEGDGLKPLCNLASKRGAHWCGVGTYSKKCPLHCTLLAYWGEESEEPWFIVTDLLPEQANAAWYGLRAWIERGFRYIKRGGWQWNQTRITDPKRIERFWVALAVATLWVISVGGEAEVTQPVSGLEHLPENHIARRRVKRRCCARLVSCFRQGIKKILAALLSGLPLPLGHFYPHPWPSFSDLPAT
jgi:hypothetical protein